MTDTNSSPSNTSDAQTVDVLAACDVGAVVSLPEHDINGLVSLVGHHRKGDLYDGIWVAVDAETGRFKALIEDGGAPHSEPVPVEVRGHRKELPATGKLCVEEAAVQTVVSFLKDSPKAEALPEKVESACAMLTSALSDEASSEGSISTGTQASESQEPDFHNPVADFSPTERRRIIADVMHWRKEYDDGDLDGDEFDKYLANLKALSDTELKTRWYETVGEWVLSRTDIGPPSGIDTDQWLAYNMGRLIDGNRTDYGWVYSITVPKDAGERIEARTESGPPTQQTS